MLRRQLLIGFAGYLLVGTGAVLAPSLMPAITAEFTAVGLSLAVIGLLAPAASAGRIAGTLLAGYGSDRLGRQRLVWLTALLLAAALALTAGAMHWLLFVLGYVVVGLVQGALSTGINAMIADAAHEARARALNMLHGVYGLGAALSPVVIGALVGAGLPWRWTMAGVGGLWLLYGLVTQRLARGEASETQAQAAQQWRLAMLLERPFLALFLVAFIYNGIASSLLNWVALYTQALGGFSALGSVSMVALFYVGLTAGRFICAALAERLGYGRTFLALALGVLATYPLVVLGAQPLTVSAGVFGAGLSLSGLFPTALADAARRYPGQTGAVTGTLTVALTLGSIIPPAWTGVLADAAGLQVALGVNYALALLLLGLARYLWRRPSAA
ncbi:MAG: MFS transporter [Anaerolineae bacterium]|jgi:FHS family glucose/mannose:H+ symporter-like MFS transporter